MPVTAGSSIWPWEDSGVDRHFTVQCVFMGTIGFGASGEKFSGTLVTEKWRGKGATE